MILALSIGAAVLVAVVVLLLVALASLRRRHRLDFHLPAGEIDDELENVAALTHSHLTGGNRVALIQNGDAYVATCASMIEQAEHTVHFETFLWRTGCMSARIVEALTKQAARGVTVRLMLDGIGSKLTREERAALVKSGVHLCFYRPVRWRYLGLLNNRTHRKILVVDGRSAVVGGHCVTDKWLGRARNQDEYRDISVRVEGPVVRQIQAAFAENWIEGTGKVPYGRGVFPPLDPAGTTRCHCVYVNPAYGVSSTKLLHHLVLRRAQKRVWIQSPYFVPDDGARAALIDAARRGVDVRVLTPDVRVTDNRLVAHAGHHRLAPFVEAGVRVYHFHRTLSHQKVWTIDGELALVGTTNFDERSFHLDDQITLSIADPEIVSEIDRIMLADLRDSELLDFETWKHRSPFRKAGDALAYLLRENL